MNFGEILRALVAAGVRFVVIGGVAATAHGSAYITDDLDICYDPEPDNIEQLAALLTEWGAYMRGVEPGLPFSMDARTFRTTPVMTLVTRHGKFDVLDRVDGVGSFADVLRASELFEAFSTRFHVLGLRDLIAAKRAAGRRKDHLRLPELEALLALTEQSGTDAPSQDAKPRPPNEPPAS